MKLAGTQLKRTPLYEAHVAAGARMVAFGDWEMPLHYGSQIEEHLATRRAAGLFDVSHMGEIEVEGSGALELLQALVAWRSPGWDDFLANTVGVSAGFAGCG
ncbi:hypothetical protein IIC65_08940 [Candidatus Sumerlaeota bacterium]|nr:hypothetical protein [Candidatus Sumerlaeota bacterium]